MASSDHRLAAVSGPSFPYGKGRSIIPAPQSVSNKSSEQGQIGGRVMKSLSEKGAHHTESDVLKELVARALWASFPEAASEDELSTLAAPYFRNKNGNPIEPRTVRYWLRGQTLPSALHISTLFAMQPKMFMTSWLGRAA